MGDNSPRPATGGEIHMLNSEISFSLTNCTLISQGVNNFKELGILLVLRELFTTVVPQALFLKRNFRSLSLNYFYQKTGLRQGAEEHSKVCISLGSGQLRDAPAPPGISYRNHKASHGGKHSKIIFFSRGLWRVFSFAWKKTIQWMTAQKRNKKVH